MDLRTKAILCIVPFLVAAYVGFALAAPAVQLWQEKAAAVEEKRKEHEDLENKLRAKAKIQKEKADLNAAIDKLRDSVPKRPELELLNIDLEKMALESGIDIITFKEMDKDGLKTAGIQDEALLEKPSLQKGKEEMAKKVKTAMTPVTGPKKDGAKEEKTGPPDTGLANLTLQIKVIGDYLSLMDFVKKLETYQRVVALTSIDSHIPKKMKEAKATKELPDDATPSEDDEQGDTKRLQTTILLTTYYLP